MIALILQSDWSALGNRLAEKLIAANHEVTVVVSNGQQNQKLAAVVQEAEIVITLFSTSQQVEDAYLGSNGILEHAAPASLLIDLSTSSPRRAKELHALAAVHDHRFVEAPLCGDADMFEADSFRIYAAGEPDNLTKALPILTALTPDVFEAGLPGSGVILKLASQIALASTLMGVIEAITFSLVAGMEGPQILKALEKNPAATAVASTFGRKIIDEDFYYGLELQQFFFDLTAALDAADEYGLALPGLETAHQLYDLLVLVGGSKKGMHALALIYYEEERCAQHGLNWGLAQQAMDVYERATEGVFDDCEYEDECDDPDCELHCHRRYDDDPPGPPTMSKFFSAN